jgi:hypothetical protein
VARFSFHATTGSRPAARPFARLKGLPIRVPLALPIALLAAGCADGASRDDDLGPHRFDPARIAVGDRVAGLEVVAVDVQPSQVDGAYVGSVGFSGEVTVGGRYYALHDDPSPSTLCFDVDAESAPRIPRMRHDNRKVWFCFENQAEAARLLGPPGGAGTATVTIRDYRTVHEFTDAFDTATLVAAEDAGMAGARDALLSFFALLHEQRYAEAAALYGGDYDVLRGWNPELPPDDTVALWAAGCGRNGLECMRVAEVVDQERPAPGEYRLTLRFIGRDGSQFVMGPCCGETEETMPSIRDFPFRVHQHGDRYLVQDLPIYLP